jgi:hypothetical protein
VTQLLALLMKHDLDLHCVAQNGTRIRAFRRRCVVSKR